MTRQWTDEQETAIKARGAAIIVSAAAGSGKTTVLVERLLRILSDTENKVPADRIIVVTFTNDAAAEMKQRLTLELSRRIELEPENVWLSEQQALLRTAKISTIHSFCFDLIRENIRNLDISSGFRIIDDSEEEIILGKSVEETMERGYAEFPDKMERLKNFFCTSGDFQLEEVLRNLYRFAVSVPYYEDWLDRQLSSYDELNPRLSGYYLKCLADRLISCMQDAMVCREMAEGIGAVEAEELLSEESEMFRKMAERLLSEEDIEWDNRVLDIGKVNKFDTINFRRIQKNTPERATADKVMEIRDGYKKAYNGIKPYLFSQEEIFEDLKLHKEILTDLVLLLKVLCEEISARKTEKNAIGFSDAEQLAIKLLSEKDEEGNIRKTRLAEELSEYYRLIMIDEFQDANNTQDLIFKLLSHGGTPEENGDNMFLVGDVKQSIYRFRLANPSIFVRTLENSERYEDGFSGKHGAVLLNKNFRSSQSVVDFVNFIFEGIMSKDVGEINYTDDEKLVQGARFEDDINRDTELMIVKIPEKNNSAEDNGDSDEEPTIVAEEARAVAEKIRGMLFSGCQVNDRGTLRACRNRDFCILLRGHKSGKLFADELGKCGIKAHTEEVDGYLKSREISVLLNLLQVIDNPLKDIPLVSVLMSPMFGMTAEETAKIRVFSDEKSFYRALVTAVSAEENSAESYFTKGKEFLKALADFRVFAAEYPLEKLIRTIYDSTDFLSVVQLYRDGEQKKANLRLLLEYAKSYQGSSNGGLSGFIRYINNISAQGGDLKCAGTISLAEDVVTIKTIHKSKGLEFPFVFLCGTGKAFNMRDKQKQTQIDLDFGIGFKIQDRKKLRKYPSLPHYALSELCGKNSLSEEMRLMYVALTRAKEKLFITIDMNESVQKKLFRFAAELRYNDGKIMPSMAQKANCMQDWILMCMLNHRDGGYFRHNLEIDVAPRIDNPTVKITECGAVSAKENAPEESSRETSESRVDELRKILAFRYDKRLSDLPAKLTVSEISHDRSVGDILLRRPEFTQEKGLSGAEKGTATHTFMQYADFALAEKDVPRECGRLAEKGYLTAKQADSVDTIALEKFFSSELYGRIRNALSVERERKFLMAIDDLKLSDELGEQYRNTGGMLQGIADCVFEEEDGFVLIDYKTDFVKSAEELRERYFRQLELYKYALEQIYDKPVKEVSIYSFCKHETVRLI